jgi:myo-inositol-1(or 4)-monophosphatase
MLERIEFKDLVTLSYHFFRSLDDRYFAEENGEKLGRKAGHEQVGSLDVEVQDRFLRLVETHFPKHVPVSEEMRYEWPVSDKAAIFDPIDGTANEGLGMGSYGSMLTLQDAGRLVFTAIYLPWEEALRKRGFYAAGQGCGAWQQVHGNLIRLKVSSEPLLAGTTLLVEGPTRVTRDSLELTRLSRAVHGTRDRISCAWGFTRVAASNRLKQEVPALIAIGNTKPTDNLHAVLMIEEAGGRVTDLRGAPITTTNFENMLATNGLVHEEALRIIAA